MATRSTQRIKEQVVRALERDEPETPRQQILDEASEAVHGARNLNYGNPEDNFANIANLWTGYWRAKFPGTVNFDSYDVAIMCMLIKVARLATNPNHHDSAVDIAGYATCLGDIQNIPNRAKQAETGEKYLHAGLQESNQIMKGTTKR